MSRMYARVLKNFPAIFLSVVSAKMSRLLGFFVEVSDDDLVKTSEENVIFLM